MSPLRLAISVFAGVAVASWPAAADTVQVLTVDGQRLVGELGDCQADSGLILRLDDGERRIPWDDLLSLEMMNRQPVPVGSSFVEVELIDDGVVFGQLRPSGPGRVAVQTALGLSLELPFKLLRVVRRPPASDPHVQNQIDRALADAGATRDTLIAKKGGKVTALPVAIEGLDADEVHFSFADRRRTACTAEVAAVVFASTMLERPAAVRVTLADRTTLSGRLISAPEGRLRLQLAEGVVADVSLDHLVRLDRHSGRVVFLSDLEPLESQSQGFFSTTWPIERDRSVTGGPLSIAGQGYRKGLGVHSPCRVVYALEGQFAVFAAEIGIDDSAEGKGNAVFKVRADGELVFDSGPVCGGEPARPVHVNVEGRDRLTLVVEMGEALDLADHADWANARLLRRDSP